MADRLNLEDTNVFEAEMTVEQVRNFMDGMEFPDDVEAAFDEAQGHVFSDQDKEAWLVIKITK